MVNINELVNIIIDPDDCDARLHYASLTGQIDVIQQLRSAGDAEFDFPNMINHQIRPIGATPLRLAVTGGHLHCAQLLVSLGAAIDLPDFKGQTPLFAAIRYHHIDCAKFVLEKGADPNGDSHNRCTPLYIAAQEGYLDGVQVLLQYGADTEINRISGGLPGFPLHTAAIYHNLECFVALLLGGAEPDSSKIPIDFPPTVLNSVTLPHIMVKHGCPQVFAAIAIEFGMNPWQRDRNNCLASEMIFHGPCTFTLQEAMKKPLSMQSLCRIQVRRAMGKKRLNQLDKFELAKPIIDILKYEDVLRILKAWMVYCEITDESHTCGTCTTNV